MDDIQLIGIQEAYTDSPVVLRRLLLAPNGKDSCHRSILTVLIYKICYEVELTCTRHALD